ncbi:MAG: RdgB/HAM1 family non-canonical purine NTP pyrophosphatase [Methylocystaceae bacterium]|nr:RdgB/HAM1 family non-canonical purine NTP pyrophosphatase [Methylocystaceae bacterium]
MKVARMRILLASSNLGKIRAFEQILAPLGINIIPQSQLNLESPEETGCTFVENALIKARHASEKSGLPALADDSGILVNALNGAPGLYSARYAQTDSAAKERLLKELSGVPEQARGAHYYAVLVYVEHPLDPAPIIADARLYGRIAEEARGNEGFGYDALFYLPEYQCTLAELPNEIRNKISNRAQALHQLIARLKERSS